MKSFTERLFDPAFGGRKEDWLYFFKFYFYDNLVGTFLVTAKGPLTSHRLLSSSL